MEKRAEKVGLVGAVKNFFKYYATFSGRSSRSEYWFLQLAGVLFYVVALVPLSIVSNARDLLVLQGVITFAFLVGLIVPTLAVMARRLRDAGISPYFLFFIFLPVLGGLALFVMMMFPTKEQPLGSSSPQP